jgi:hypothetical protein
MNGCAKVDDFGMDKLIPSEIPLAMDLRDKRGYIFTPCSI